jgi:CubicO group peptidase (beta-lactamase class C family)
MRKLVPIFVLSCLAIFAQSSPSAGGDFATKADAHLKAYLDQGKFQGSALIAKGGKILLAKGYGMANEEHDVPNKPNTKFRLGSITKQFTAVAILQLQEQGKLNVKDPIGKYIPNSPDAWKTVTIHHLLTHTSGIPSYTSVPEYGKRMRESSSTLDFLARFKDKALDFEPGSKYTYSNSGYFLLGVIIEQVSGLSYEKYLRQNIFDKVDMQDSGYDWDSTILKNRAAGYSLDKDGKHRNAPFLDMGQPYAAGSLYSTVEDLYRWDRVLNTEKVLSKKSLDAAWTPALNNYGYGWTISKIAGDHRVIAHGGGINGFATTMMRLPEDDAFIAVFSNLESANPGKIGSELARLLLGENVEPPRERKAVNVPAEVLARYAGKYQLGPMVLTVTSEKTHLMAQLTGQPPIQFQPESETKVFTKVVDAQMTFGAIENGKSQTVTLHQGGRDQVAKRIPD